MALKANKITDDWLEDDPLGWELLDWLTENDLSIGLGINLANSYPSNDGYQTEETIYLIKQHLIENAFDHDINDDVNNNSQNKPQSTLISDKPTSLAQKITHHKNIIETNNNASKTNETATLTTNEKQQSMNDNQQSEEHIIKFDGDTSRANPHFVPLLPKPIHQGESGRQLIMDTETTGLDALKGDRIVEVGIVELINRKFTGEKLHVYINPQRSMDEEVIRIHGISEAFLADKPTFDQVAQPLYDFMVGAEVIAHNAPFDISFLSMEFDKVGLSDFTDKITVTDSLAMAKRQYPGQKNTLDALVRRLNVGKMDRTFHGALLDSEILAEVYLAMTGGQVSLAIDEDTQTEGNKSHLDFSHLSDKLIDAGHYSNDHLNWVIKQTAKYPNLAHTQGIFCYHKVEDSDELRHLVLRQLINLKIHDLNLANNLFLANA